MSYRFRANVFRMLGTLLLSFHLAISFKPPSQSSYNFRRPHSKRFNQALIRLQQQVNSTGLLNQALGGLTAHEQYNAVLVSLLKDGGCFHSAISLVDEMMLERVPLKRTSLVALFNSALMTSTTTDVTSDSRLLSAICAMHRHGACAAFAGLAPTLRPTPSAYAELLPLPKDESGAEVAGAAAAGALAAAAMIAHPPAAALLSAFGGAWGLDRYTQHGRFFELVSRGFARLDQGPLSKNMQRDCAFESASFLLGYLLGLPCCADTPCVERPLQMLKQSGKQLSLTLTELLDHEPSTDLSSARLTDRILIWLLAPAAMESSSASDGQVGHSSPNFAMDFLRAARRQEVLHGVNVQQGGWVLEDDDARVRWAFAEAKALLRQHANLREELQELLAIGTSFGECVMKVEERLQIAR